MQRQKLDTWPVVSCKRQHPCTQAGSARQRADKQRKGQWQVRCISTKHTTPPLSFTTPQSALQNNRDASQHQTKTSIVPFLAQERLLETNANAFRHQADCTKPELLEQHFPVKTTSGLVPARLLSFPLWILSHFQDPCCRNTHTPCLDPVTHQTCKKSSVQHISRPCPGSFLLHPVTQFFLPSTAPLFSCSCPHSAGLVFCFFPRVSFRRFSPQVWLCPVHAVHVAVRPAPVISVASCASTAALHKGQVDK